jgi:hypothetical protein
MRELNISTPSQGSSTLELGLESSAHGGRVKQAPRNGILKTGSRTSARSHAGLRVTTNDSTQEFEEESNSLIAHPIIDSQRPFASTPGDLKASAELLLPKDPLRHSQHTLSPPSQTLVPNSTQLPLSKAEAVSAPFLAPIQKRSDLLHRRRMKNRLAYHCMPPALYVNVDYANPALDPKVTVLSSSDELNNPVFHGDSHGRLEMLAIEENIVDNVAAEAMLLNLDAFGSNASNQPSPRY